MLDLSQHFAIGTGEFVRTLRAALGDDVKYVFIKYVLPIFNTIKYAKRNELIFLKSSQKNSNKNTYS